MTVWLQLERLLHEAGIEDKTAGEAGGARGPRCAHGLPMSKCAACAITKGQVSKSKKKKGDRFTAEMNPNRVSDKEVLEQTKDERSKPHEDGGKGISFQEWQMAIERDLLGFIKKNYEQSIANDYIGAWRRYEKAASSNDPESWRRDFYEHGTSYDDYVAAVLVQKTGYDNVARAFKSRIAKGIKRRAGTEGQDDTSLPGQTLQAGSSDKISIERETPEFQAWEENVALPHWKQMYGTPENRDPVPDEAAWNETLNFFAAEGDRGPNWKYFYELDKQNSPWFDKILKRKYDGAIGSPQRRRAEYDQTVAGFNVPGQQAMALYNPQAIQMDKEKQRQIDPELFRKKKYGAPPEHDKRRFMTWWRPFGFKGDIPFSDM